MKIEIHPLSATLGAFAAALLLFACSSSSGAGSPPVQTAPTVSTQVTFYSETATPTGTSLPSAFALGTTAAPTVITDVSWSGNSARARLLVNGAPVYCWGFGGEYVTSGGSAGAIFFAVAPRFTLAHGIKVPANAVLTVETSGSLGAVSLAGYTE